ncbi:hypothetical protein HID67_04120 [Pasteurella multocida]|uniref:hypothetical protein n=1 Tax=Pasteurella multocida TaxID=747 RepID=UPI0014616ED5|nr:hypothetical protein [Pasteurella multocida]NMR22543.1 hypothetical protein [Pasteurella multocida]
MGGAIEEGKRLIDLDKESRGNEKKKENKEKGRSTRVEARLEEECVEYGEERNGFKKMKENEIE